MDKNVTVFLFSPARFLLPWKEHEIVFNWQYYKG